jgi:hypothetical protein
MEGQHYATSKAVQEAFFAYKPLKCGTTAKQSSNFQNSDKSADRYGNFVEK